MIVREDGDQLILVRQADHGLLSGWLAAAWGASPWAVPEPYDSAVVGARLHDMAWTPFDEALPLRPDGRPYAFHEVSRTVTTRLYTRGIDAVEAIDGYAGLLTSLHFSGFLTSHWDWLHAGRPTELAEEERAAVERFVEQEQARQARLRDQLGVDAAHDRQLMCNYFWLQLWDRISLDVCRQGFSGWSADYPATPASTEAGAATVRLHVELRQDGVCCLEPYPLVVNPFRARVPAVRVPLAGERAALRDAWRAGCRDSIEISFRPRSTELQPQDGQAAGGL